MISSTCFRIWYCMIRVWHQTGHLNLVPPCICILSVSGFCTFAWSPSGCASSARVSVFSSVSSDLASWLLILVLSLVKSFRLRCSIKSYFFNIVTYVLFIVFATHFFGLFFSLYFSRSSTVLLGQGLTCLFSSAN